MAYNLRGSADELTCVLERDETEVALALSPNVEVVSFVSGNLSHGHVSNHGSDVETGDLDVVESGDG